MAKLYFRYGAMGSSKTANALMTRHNYLEKGKTVLMLKPKAENRDGEMIIRSRIGLQAKCRYVEDFIDYVKTLTVPPPWDAVIVDEVQFITAEQADMLAQFVDLFDIPVICYGLKTDFQGKLFEGSKRLIELADEIEEIPTICWCGKKAHFNARVLDGKVIREGEQKVLGGNEMYTALCRKHFFSGNLGN